MGVLSGRVCKVVVVSGLQKLWLPGTDLWYRLKVALQEERLVMYVT